MAEAARGPLAAVTASQAGVTAGPNLLNLNHPRPVPGMTLALAPDMAALSLAPATATFKIEAQADNGLMGSLAVWGLEASHENGLPVKWHDMTGCRGGPSQEFYITKIGEPNEYRIEAQADNGLMGSLAVWGLEASHENGLPVRWHDMTGCRGGPSQKFYITKIGEPNMYRIEARADNGLMGSLAVWGLESSHENGLPVKWHDMSWFRGGPSQEFYITPPLR